MGAITHNGEVLQRLPANASQINFDKTGTNLNSTQTENAIKEVNVKVNTNANDIDQLKSGLIDQTAGNTFRIDTAKMPLYYDGASYSGYVSFPFVTKNTNYTVTLLDVEQNNVGTVTESATVGLKKLVGFSFNITGTYDSTKCGASIICEITFA